MATSHSTHSVTTPHLLLVGSYLRRSDNMKYKVHRIYGTHTYTLTIGGKVVGEYGSKAQASRAATLWPA